MDKILKIIENESLESSVKYFLSLSEDERKDFINGGILNNISDGIVNLKYIMFLEEMYYEYNDYDAIYMLEHIFSIWYPPYIKESYEIACYYKKKMIHENIYTLKNIEDLLNMSNPLYREYFNNDYISTICNYVVDSNVFSDNVTEKAKNIIVGLKNGGNWWNYNLNM